MIWATVTGFQVLLAARKLRIVDSKAPTLAGLCKVAFEDIMARWDEVQAEAQKEAA